MKKILIPIIILLILILFPKIYTNLSIESNGEVYAVLEGGYGPYSDPYTQGGYYPSYNEGYYYDQGYYSYNEGYYYDQGYYSYSEGYYYNQGYYSYNEGYYYNQGYYSYNEGYYYAQGPYEGGYESYYSYDEGIYYDQGYYSYSEGYYYNEGYYSYDEGYYYSEGNYPLPTPTPTPGGVCAAPTILTHSDTNQAGGGTVSFTWSAVPGATQYTIQRQRTDGTWSTRATQAGTSFSGGDGGTDPDWRIFVSASDGSCTVPGNNVTFDPGGIIPTNTPTPTPTPGFYTISGNVYSDANVNGVRDPGELGVNNATVTGSPGLGSQTTNPSGNYSFASVPNGTYSVDLTVPAGYFNTTTDPVTTTVGPNATVNFGITNSSACQDGADNNGNGLNDICEPGCDTNGVIVNPPPSCPTPTPGGPPPTPTPTPGGPPTPTPVFGYNPLDPSENPECSDTINNDGQEGADIGDKDCHSDGNVGNPGTYVPSFPSESSVPPLCENLTALSSTVGSGDTTTLTAESCASLGTPTFSWSASAGTITPGGTSSSGVGFYTGSATFTAPTNVCSQQNVTAQVNATNSNGTISYFTDILVTPKNVLSGAVLADTGGNLCTSGTTPFGSGATVTVYSGGNPTANDVTDVSGSFSVIDTTTCGSKTAVISSVPGYKLKAVRFDGGAWTSTGVSGFTYGPFDFSDDHTLDLCISNLVQWFQTASGNVRMTALVNRVPGGQSASTDPNNPSLFFSSSFAGDFGTGQVSLKGWKVDDEYSYQGDAKNRNGSASYSFYVSRATQKNVPIQNIPGCGEGACTAGISNLATGVYRSNGDLTLTSYSHAAGAHVLILVNGNLMIQSNVPVPAGANNLLIIAAKGKITIDKSVGTTDLTSASPHIQGILTAEGSIEASGDTCPSGTPDKRLNIQGSLIANSVKPFTVGGGGAFVNNRSLCLEDKNYPSVHISPRYDFVTQLTDFYRTSYTRFREIAP